MLRSAVMTDEVSLRVVQKVAEVPQYDWDALVGDASPFLKWDWLDSLEQSGCVKEETGWFPPSAGAVKPGECRRRKTTKNAPSASLRLRCAPGRHQTADGGNHPSLPNPQRLPVRRGHLLYVPPQNAPPGHILPPPPVSAVTHQHHWRKQCNRA